jgi:hypothetical protein
VLDGRYEEVRHGRQITARLRTSKATFPVHPVIHKATHPSAEPRTTGDKTRYPRLHFAAALLACDIRAIFGAPKADEAKRRTRVATLFPNAASCLRLVSAVAMEISEEWLTGSTYLTINED